MARSEATVEGPSRYPRWQAQDLGSRLNLPLDIYLGSPPRAGPDGL